MKRLLFLAVLLLCCRGVCGAPGGLVVQSSDYDPVTKVTTVHLLNTSHQDITAFGLSFRVILPDGTLSAPAGIGQEIIETYIHGDRLFPPGGTFDQQIQTGPLTATVALVVYANKTAEVVDDSMFQSIMGDRAGQVKAMQEVNSILSAALADPSIDPVQKIQALIAATDDTVSAGYRFELQSSLYNMNRRDKQEGMRAVIAGNEKRLPAMIEHSQLNKVVLP